MGQANINRGRKWVEVRKNAEFENRMDEVTWLDSQKSIQEDIKEYEDYIKPGTKLKKEK